MLGCTMTPIGSCETETAQSGQQGDEILSFVSKMSNDDPARSVMPAGIKVRQHRGSF